MSDWDARFLQMAALVATWSKDPSTKVGAVITRGKFVISLGFNGHPSGIDDSAARLHDREQKYRTIIHAEMNAILSARQPLDGCTLYVVPFMPCSNCGAVIVQAGSSASSPSKTTTSAGSKASRSPARSLPKPASSSSSAPPWNSEANHAGRF